VLVLNRKGRILHLSAEANRLIGTPANEQFVLLAAGRMIREALSARRGPLVARVAGTVGKPLLLRLMVLPEAVVGMGPTGLILIEEGDGTPLDDDALTVRFRLSGREIAVARLIGLGLGNDQIAQRLAISPHTARRHTERVLRKLGVTSRSAVAARLMGADTGSSHGA
jgi:DNA-binding CsgD family transcriptional regulator